MTDQAAQGLVTEPVDPNLDDVIPEDDPEVANYPPMATGNNCTKNWDTSLLQNCTGDRMKAIAAALDVTVTTRVRKYILYRAIYNAMNNDQTCPSCPGGDCQPNAHMFMPTEQPPPRMGHGRRRNIRRTNSAPGRKLLGRPDQPNPDPPSDCHFKPATVTAHNSDLQYWPAALTAEPRTWHVSTAAGFLDFREYRCPSNWFR